MKAQIKLKWFISLVFVTLGLTMLVGYTMLAAHYFILGMDNMVANQMARAGQRALEALNTSGVTAITIYEDYDVSREWREQPEYVRELFNDLTVFPDFPIKREGALPPGEQRIGPPKALYFVMRYEAQGQTVYVSYHVSPKTVSELVHQNINRRLGWLLVVGVLSAFALALVIWFVLRRVTQPISNLQHWTRGLSADNLTQPVPDFAYPELNELADLIRSSLSAVQQALAREHRFLRHASHELRTPINVIRSNIELMHKLQRDGVPDDDGRREQALARIDRASLTMKHLTETLLWLNRDETDTLSRQVFELDVLLRQLIEESGYLLKSKAVEVELQTETCSLHLPEIAVRIVLGNLIRNAFQHTWEGRVLIRQTGNQVQIENVQNDNVDAVSDQGFGLGLELTRQLVARLGWVYESTSRASGHSASVKFG